MNSILIWQKIYKEVWNYAKHTHSEKYLKSSLIQTGKEVGKYMKSTCELHQHRAMGEATLGIILKVLVLSKTFETWKGDSKIKKFLFSSFKSFGQREHYINSKLTP